MKNKDCDLMLSCLSVAEESIIAAQKGDSKKLRSADRNIEKTLTVLVKVLTPIEPKPRVSPLDFEVELERALSGLREARKAIEIQRLAKDDKKYGKRGKKIEHEIEYARLNKAFNRLLNADSIISCVSFFPKTGTKRRSDDIQSSLALHAHDCFVGNQKLIKP